MKDDQRPWAAEAFRRQVGSLVDRIQAGDIEPAAMDLWKAAFTQVGSWVFAEGLWNIWGGITDEFTHPRGDAAQGCRVATVAATDLRSALGDEEREREYCDEWVKRLCG